MTAVEITYFSDVLCVWAYVAERRVAQLVTDFGDDIAIVPRFCSVFPDAHGKIAKSWGARGGFEGFSRHLVEVGGQFPHIDVHDRLWLETRPTTSAAAHLFLKAVQAVEGEDDLPPYLERLSTRADSAVRRAFFAEARDISDWRVHREIAGELGIDYDQVADNIRSSAAIGALAMDLQAASDQGITGSPTLVMNNGRQKLFGNVGYRLLEANVQELLHNPSTDEASWC